MVNHHIIFTFKWGHEKRLLLKTRCDVMVDDGGRDIGYHRMLIPDPDDGAQEYCAPRYLIVKH
jgi:hypothetical protein